MPPYFPENNTPHVFDPQERSLAKIANLIAGGGVGGRWLDTISDLKAETNHVGIRNIRGYSSSTDGVELPSYYADLSDTTSSDNGGSIIVAADGTRWKWVRVPVVLTSAMFGVKADDTVETTAMQNAADYAIANGLKLLMRDGITRTRKITFDGDLTIEGDGDGTVWKHEPDSPVQSLIARSGSGDHKVAIRHLKIDGNKSSFTDRPSAVRFAGDSIVVEDVTFVNTVFSAIRVDESNQLCVIENCRFSEMAEHGGSTGETSRAIYVGDLSSKVRIQNNRFQADAPSVSGRAPGGIYITGTSEDITIIGNTFDGIGQTEASNFIGNIDLYEDAHKTIVTNNRIINFRNSPLKLQNASSVICQGNVIDTTSDASNVVSAIAYQPAARSQTPPERRSVIIGNIINDYGQGSGIVVNGNATNGSTGDVIVEANVIVNGASTGNAGIVAEYCNDNVTIGRNEIKSSSGYGVLLENIENTLSIIGNVIDTTGQNGVFSRTGVSTADLTVSNNQIRDASGNSISIRTVRNASVIGNQFYGSATPLDLVEVSGVAVVTGNMSDGPAPVIPEGSGTGIASIVRRDNNWGGSFDNNDGAAASVSDGGNISHGLVATPESAIAVGSVAGEIVSVTGLGAANITVSVKLADGSTAGTSQTIYWSSKVT